MSTPSTTCDVAILGLGGMGSAAAWHLARRGATVVGIDQFGPAHDLGSSHGETRIIRKAYFEHPSYVPLLQRAYALWHDLERCAGRTLFHQVGLFIGGLPECESVAGTLQAAREHHLPLERFTASQAERRFPGFRFPPEFLVVREAQAGYLEVENCVRAQLEAARSLGADLRFHQPVLGWDLTATGVSLQTASTTIHAQKLVLAAGPWASQFIPQLTVRRKPVFWFPCTSELTLEHGAGTFFLETATGQFYGFPSLDGQAFKVAEHTGGQTVHDLSQVDRALQPDDLEPIREFLQTYVPAARLEPSRHSVCLYTLTPDQHFLIDTHPDSERIIVAAGFSGHGFKFTPVVGEAVADLALSGQTDLPIGFLSWKRPAMNQSSPG